MTTILTHPDDEGFVYVLHEETDSSVEGSGEDLMIFADAKDDNFVRLNHGLYLAMSDCVTNDGIPTKWSASETDDGTFDLECTPTFERDGKRFVKSDGIEVPIEGENLRVRQAWKACFQSEGHFLEANPSVPGSVDRCVVTGTKDGVFGAFLDQDVAKKENGMSTGAKVALGILGAIVVVGGGYLLLNNSSDSKGGYKSNPSSQSELQRLFALADSDTISQEALDDLSKNPEWGVRARVAYNPRTSTKTLKALANDSDPSVQGQAVDSLNARGVAATKHTTDDPEEFERTKLQEKFRLADEATFDEFLDSLALDESWGVRVRVAYNPNTSVKTLQRLAKDSNNVVREEALLSLKKKTGKNSSGGNLVSVHPPRGSQQWWNGLEWVFKTAKEAAEAESRRSPRESDEIEGVVNAAVEVYDDRHQIVNSARRAGLMVYPHEGGFTVYMPGSSNEVGQATVMADVLNSYEVNSKAEIIS